VQYTCGRRRRKNIIKVGRKEGKKAIKIGGAFLPELGTSVTSKERRQLNHTPWPDGGSAGSSNSKA
jgi:hypothetical protein